MPEEELVAFIVQQTTQEMLRQLAWLLDRFPCMASQCIALLAAGHNPALFLSTTHVGSSERYTSYASLLDLQLAKMWLPLNQAPLGKTCWHGASSPTDSWRTSISMKC